MVSHVTSSAKVLSKLRASFANLHAAIDIDDVEKCCAPAAQGITRGTEMAVTTLGRQVMEAAEDGQYIVIRAPTCSDG
jgi:hypothetical protein